MKFIHHIFWGFVLSLSFAFNANATSIKDINAALQNGQYDHAAQLAGTLRTSQSLTLGAEALNAKLLLEGGTKKTAKHAMEMAKTALEIDPKNEHAQMQYTIAYGYYGRMVSNFNAYRKKLPQKTHIEILKNLDMNSTHPYAYGLMGAWHLSIVERGGAARAQKIFEADIKTGKTFFDYSLRIWPNDILLNANYASMMYALQPTLYKKWAKEKFTLVTNTKANTDLERKIQSRVKTILDLIETDETQALRIARQFAFG